MPSPAASGSTPSARATACESNGRRAARARRSTRPAAASIAIVNATWPTTLRAGLGRARHDPRHFALVALGGAGPIHAGRLAARARHPARRSCRPRPGCSRRSGCLIAERRARVVPHPRGAALRPPSRPAATDVPRRGRAACAERMARDGIAPASVQVAPLGRDALRRPVLRAGGPARGPRSTREGLDAAVSAFHEAHRRVYAYAKEGAPVESSPCGSVHARHGPRRATIDQAHAGGAAGAAAMATAHAAACSTRPSATSTCPFTGASICLPARAPRAAAIVEQPDTTTVIYPGHRAVVDPIGNLVIEVPAWPRSRDRQSAGEPRAAPLDPVTLEVLRGRLTTIADEMEMVLLRLLLPARQGGADATAAIFDRHGKTIAQAEALPPSGHADRLGPAHRPRLPPGRRPAGDAYILNDPYDGGTHLPDVTWSCPSSTATRSSRTAGTMSHHQDVGGSAPGSTGAQRRRPPRRGDPHPAPEACRRRTRAQSDPDRAVARQRPRAGLVPGRPGGSAGRRAVPASGGFRRCAGSTDGPPSLRVWTRCKTTPSASTLGGHRAHPGRHV